MSAIGNFGGGIFFIQERLVLLGCRFKAELGKSLLTGEFDLKSHFCDSAQYIFFLFGEEFVRSWKILQITHVLVRRSKKKK
jgi:hypothetical protein